MSTGVRTEAEAKQTLPAFFDDERKTKTVRAAVRRYEAHQASKGNGGNRSVKLAARARIDGGLISGDSDTDSDLAPDLTDQEVDAKYEEMYGRAAASKAGAKTGAESDTAVRIAELQRQLADQQRIADLERQLAAAATQPAPQGLPRMRIPCMMVIGVLMLLLSFVLSAPATLHQERAGVHAEPAGVAGTSLALVPVGPNTGPLQEVPTVPTEGAHPLFVPFIVASVHKAPPPPTPVNDTVYGTRTAPALPPPGDTDTTETNHDEGGDTRTRTTPWYLRPLRGSGYAFYLFVTSLTILCGIVVHSTWRQALTALAELCNALCHFEAMCFRRLRTVVVVCLALGVAPQVVSTVCNVRIVDA